MLCGHLYAPIRESVTALWLKAGSYLKKSEFSLQTDCTGWWVSGGQQVLENSDKCKFINFVSSPAVTGWRAGDNKQ